MGKNTPQNEILPLDRSWFMGVHGSIPTIFDENSRMFASKFVRVHRDHEHFKNVIIINNAIFVRY